MKKIFKFYIENEIIMPAGAKVISAQMQGGFMVLWALCSIDAIKVKRNFKLLNTGNEIDSNKYTFVSTFQDGEIVYHLFEEKI